MQTQQAQKVASVKEFVRLLARRDAADVEKVLCNLLDNAINIWNDKAQKYQRETKRKDLSKAELAEMRKEYIYASDQYYTLVRMRYGVSTQKRTFHDLQRTDRVQKHDEHVHQDVEPEPTEPS